MFGFLMKLNDGRGNTVKGCRGCSVHSRLPFFHGMKPMLWTSGITGQQLTNFYHRQGSLIHGGFHFRVTQPLLPQGTPLPSTLVGINSFKTRVKGLLKCITTCKSTCYLFFVYSSEPKRAEADYKGEIELPFSSWGCIQSRDGTWTEFSRG